MINHNNVSGAAVTLSYSERQHYNIRLWYLMFTGRPVTTW